MSSVSRRSFLQHASAGAFAAPFFIRNLISAPPSSTLRLASFGAGGMAYWTLRGIATHPKVKLACVAEVDSAKLKQVKAEYGGATVYEDWRQMLDKERKHLDIVCVGTPDHMHAPMAMASMRRGLHVYAQKPLTHDIFETRRLTEFARKKKLVTQMGIQIHSTAEYQTAVALVQQGAIGKIKEVHSWSEKKWGDPDPLPDRSDPIPSTLNWDLWLGVCAPRPYLKGYYHPGNWRKRIDFGTATFGDMGCHIFDPVFAALQLTAPISVRSEGPVPSKQNGRSTPSSTTFFQPRRTPRTRRLKWFGTTATSGLPRRFKNWPVRRRSPARARSLSERKASCWCRTWRAPRFTRRRSSRISQSQGHGGASLPPFVDAVLGTTKASAPFDYSGPLTEGVLLGTIATRFPTKRSNGTPRS
jgi:predicted dehydrogenase